MAHIVVCRSVTIAEIVRILRKDRATTRKHNKAAVRNFVERVAVGVIELKQALTPPVEPLLERDNHTVVIRDARRSVFGNLAEPGVGARRHRRTAAHLCRKWPKAKGIGVRILRQFMYAMISGVADAQGCVGAKRLLKL